MRSDAWEPNDGPPSTDGAYKINVVTPAGNWFEVRNKHGHPLCILGDEAKVDAFMESINSGEGAASMTKPFAWSYSKLKNYETCPKRHFHCDIKRDFSDEGGDAVQYGNLVHDILAKAIKDGKPIPDIHLKDLKKWADLGVSFKSKGMSVFVEQKLAIANDFTAVEYFSRHAWYRAVVDLFAVSGAVAVMLDWKTGKIVEDSVQLALSAACLFAHNPQVQMIRTQFVWIKEDATTTSNFTRADMAGLWAGLLPRIAPLEQAYKTGEYPPKPNGLCRRYCPVTSCAHNGANN